MAKRNDKTIRIACEGAGTVEMDALENFQGDLKTLSEISYQKLRASILKLGFSFPVHAWKNKDKVFILDAHQRVSVLKRLRDEEGYTVPPLPVAWIEAATKQEAAQKLLASASQYGEVTNQGLFDFMQTFKMDMPQVSSQFEFPEIDFDRFNKTFFPETKEVSFTTKAKSPDEKIEDEDQNHDGKSCPKCGYEL